ncbi:hypothetical protein BSZ35_04455 [Salinibacter sp. 10B]|uniref:hypothetical protein n=1 Tax=Salinibacter sp. 10B TaxID=1923971 RepID=UPI000CF3D3E8|nr:hypothetical protein [Salinibacter sp. 10B]PQJ33960.1 hypothetical protein BSZ35_04455 [Salinibacter sp. 10B]
MGKEQAVDSHIGKVFRSDLEQVLLLNADINRPNMVQPAVTDADGSAELSDVPPGPIKYFFPDLPGSSRENPLHGTTGPDPNEASLWRIAPQQTVMTANHETGVLDTSTEPLQEGTWVYVFPEHPGEDPPMSPMIEAKATGEGTLKRVDWSDPSRWTGKDERSPSLDAKTAGGQPYLCFPATESCTKVHVMLSPCQLSYERLGAYRRDDDPHAEDIYPLAALRCETIDADALETIKTGGAYEIGYFEAKPSEDLLQVSVPQPVQFVRAAGSAYRHAVERLKAFQAGTSLEHHHASLTYRAAQRFEDRAQESMITQAARAVEGVVDDPTVWDFLDKQRLESTLEDWSAEKSDLQDTVERLGDTLYDFMMDLPAYRQAREDLTAFVEEAGGAEALSDEDFETFVDRLGIEERLLADAEYSQAGRHYLAEQLGQYVDADPKRGIDKQGEKTWYDRVPYDLSTIRRLAGVAANALEQEAKSEAGSAIKKEDVAATHAEKAAQAHETFQNKASKIDDLTDEIESTRSRLAAWQKGQRYVRLLTSKLGLSPSGKVTGPAPSTGTRTLDDLIRTTRSAVGAVAQYVHQQVGAGKKAETLFELKGKRVQAGKEAQQALTGREAGLQQYGEKMDESTEHRRTADLYKAGRRRVGRIALAIDGLHLFFLANAYRDAARRGASIDQLSQIGIGTAEAVASIRHLSGVSTAVKDDLYDLHRRVAYVEALYFVGHAVEELAFEKDSDIGATVGHSTSAIGAGLLIPKSGFRGGAIGLGLILTGQLVVAVFSDTELEEWFKNSVWSKKGYSGYLPKGEFGSKRLTTELNDLFEIIARPRVQVLLDISEEMSLEEVRLRVEPRTFQPGLMQLTEVSLSLTSDFLVVGDETHLDKTATSLDSADQMMRKDDGTLLSASWTWDGSAVADATEVAHDQTVRPTRDFDSVEASVTLRIDYRAAKSADLQPEFEYEGSPGVAADSSAPHKSAGVLAPVYS